MDVIRTNTAGANTHTAEQIRLLRLQNFESQQIRGVQQRSNVLLGSAADRLGNIQTSSARTANKDLSVNMNIKTVFQVSAKAIATEVLRVNDLHANAGQ